VSMSPLAASFFNCSKLKLLGIFAPAFFKQITRPDWFRPGQFLT
jgi:hypothetical protein